MAGPNAMAVVRHTRVYLLDFLCSGFQLYVLLSHYLRFIVLLYVDLYVIGDTSWISYGGFMQTKQLCVFIDI